MFFHGAVISHIGCKRENNEDNYYFNGVYRKDVEKPIMEFADSQVQETILAGVFDGAGGAVYGERASLTAVSALTKYQEKPLWDMIIEQYIPHVNQMIVQDINRIGSSMGTTMALLYLKEGMANVCNLGDSRVYLFREQRLMQITYDHTQAQYLIQEKVNDSSFEKCGTEQEDRKENHILTKYLGMKNKEELRPYFMEKIPVKENDIFMLCSDGLYNMLSKEDMCQYLKEKREKTPLDIARKMTGEALLSGGKDNVTCMIIKEES